MQRELTPQLGALGATLVRFLFGFPFALLFLAVVLTWQHATLSAASAIGYRGAILSLHQTSFVLGATFSLAAGLTLQTVLLLAWLLVFNRKTFAALMRLWRPSLLAGFAGAAASQFWFLAFALATAASV